MKYRVISLITSLLLFVCLFTGCNSGNSNTIKIATKPMTEEFILSEMLKLFIEENTDLNVEITKGIGGGTSNIHPALLKGDFDLYPEYTGTSWYFVLKQTEVLDDDELFNKLNEEYNSKYDLSWVGLYGFNNTYGIGVRKDIAEKYNIKKISDLQPYAKELVFGAEPDFYERDDGYNALCEKYNVDFKKHVDIDISLKYKAIRDNKADVIDVSTTDGQLSDGSCVLLEDDYKLYHTYYCGTVVRNDTLKRHPELKEALMKMDNIITEKEMAELNNKVDTEKMDEKKVAEDFLKSKKLI